MIAAYGVALNYLLLEQGAGFRLPQLLVVAAGLLICFGAMQLRRERIRSRLIAIGPKQIASAAVISALTLLGLEIVFTATGMATYFPSDISLSHVEAVPWWICEDLGCHYHYENAVSACANGVTSGRHCIVNRQGFADSEDFQAGPDYADKTRIFVMGDSFTHGFTAQVGKSYVETLEAALPDIIVWNAGITATGTSQAVAAFEAFAPRLRPQLSILGFYMNDFLDNQMPMGGGVHLQDSNGKQFFALRFQLDRWGNPFEVPNDVNFAYVSRELNPPTSEMERALGLTRLGSLALRLLDSLSEPFRRAATERQEQITRQYLTQLRDAASELDSVLLVLLIPQASDIGDPGDEYRLAVKLMDELANRLPGPD